MSKKQKNCFFFKVPSRVWTSRGDWGPSVYVGGYKTTLNEDFLRDHNIRLIVNTAKNLAVVFGVKFIRKLEVIACFKIKK